MPWSSVNASIEFWGTNGQWTTTTFSGGAFSQTEEARIVTAIEQIYLNSWIARNKLDAWVAAGNKIRILEIPYSMTAPQPGRAINDGPNSGRYIGLSLDAAEDLYYFDNNGIFVQERLGLTILHELLHMIDSLDDLEGSPIEIALNDPTFDQDGEVLPIQNTIAEQMGWSDSRQVGYAEVSLDGDYGPLAYRFDRIQKNYSYTEGNEITNVRIGRPENSGQDILDHSERESARDLMLGLGGDDYIYAGAQDDYLYGGAGEDTLYGGSGNDLIHGADILNPGTDDIDTADYSSGDDGLELPSGITFLVDYTSPVTVDDRTLFSVLNDGYGDIDRLVSIERVIATDSSDTFKFNGVLEPSLDLSIRASVTSAGAEDTVDLSGSGNGYIVVSHSNGVAVQAQSGGGAVLINEFKGNVIGSSGQDFLSGGVIVDGGDGSDYIDGGEFALGGAGVDRLAGGGDGGAGNDWYSDGGTVVLSAGGGHDFIDEDGYYTIDVGDVALADLQLGLELNVDYVSPYTMEGFEQEFVETRYEGRMCLMLSSGDTINIGTYSGMHDTGAPVFQDFYGYEFSTPWTYFEYDAYDYLEIMSNGEVYSFYDLISAWQIDHSESGWGLSRPAGSTVSASHFNARDAWESAYTGYTVADVPAQPTDGDDTFFGDLFEGVVDFAQAVAGVVVNLSLSGRQDTGGSGLDQLIGFRDVVGSAFADVLTASPVEYSNLDGGGGDDQLLGDVGVDYLRGGDGDDILSGGQGADYLDGGDGLDQINFAGSVSDFTFTRTEEGVIIITDTVGPEGIDRVYDVESVYFSASAGSHSLEDLAGGYGTAGDDTWIEGTGAANNLFGLAGDDHLVGRAGDDVINGGDGFDQVNYYGASADYVITRGSDGSITIGDTVGDEGVDTLLSVEAVYFVDDSVWGALDDLVADYGTSGADSWLEGTGGDDFIYGLAGDDQLVGRAGDDVIDGGDGFDQATYFGNSAGYSVVENLDGSVTITDQVGNEGSDTLIGVEALYFDGDAFWTTVEDATDGLRGAMAGSGWTTLGDGLRAFEKVWAQEHDRALAFWEAPHDIAVWKLDPLGAEPEISRDYLFFE